ncbi:hypothetical protein FRC20_009417 [Serendipita sp. 405]|nr:hypothetical protein FRC20_009417 [Serendipita sp. 405]
MTSNIEDEDKELLYLHHVLVDTPIKSGYRAKLNVDGSDMQLTRNEQTSAWVPHKSLEVSESSDVQVTLKTGYTIAGVSFGKEESIVNVDVRGAIQRFLLTMQPEILVPSR